jgi:hypothetical protein
LFSHHQSRCIPRFHLFSSTFLFPRFIFTSRCFLPILSFCFDFVMFFALNPKITLFFASAFIPHFALSSRELSRSILLVSFFLSIAFILSFCFFLASNVAFSHSHFSKRSRVSISLIYGRSLAFRNAAMSMSSLLCII